MTRVTVLVPTWNAPDTLGPAVRSALRQTVTDLEVLIVGDGVLGPARSVIDTLLGEDPRVRFLDLPKGENRGERNRDAGVRDARGDIVVYLADDDLLLPRHVENLLTLLEDVPFVQSRNGCFDADDNLRLYPTDLGDPECIEWHLKDPPRNRVSITGTAHTREAYLQLERGWEVPPGRMWPDLHCWRQFFRQPGFRGATHPEMTTLQFPGHLRMDDPAADLARFLRWEVFSQQPDAHERLQEMADEAASRSLVRLSAKAHDARLTIARLRRQLADQEASQQATRERARRAEAQLAALPTRRLRRTAGRLRSRMRQLVTKRKF